MIWSERFRNSSATRRVSARYDRRMPSCRVDDRRVHEQEELLAPWRAVPARRARTAAPSSASASSRGFAIVAERADEHRIRPVVSADALQASQDVRQVAAEHAAIGVQFVDDDVAQVLEELRPSRMVRQDARVQHVGVATAPRAPAANRAACVLRRVAVVGEDADRRRRSRPQSTPTGRAARRADPARAPSSETGTARATTGR